MFRQDETAEVGAETSPPPFSVLELTVEGFAMAFDAHSDQSAQITRRRLCRSDDDTVFAYAHGHDLIRRSDRTLWAHVANGVLVSARSGEPLAYQVDNTFYDYRTRQPLYYHA
jgi:hypothetical protein